MVKVMGMIVMMVGMEMVVRVVMVGMVMVVEMAMSEDSGDDSDE